MSRVIPPHPAYSRIKCLSTQTLRGPLALPQTRLDLAPDGQAVVKGNIVNQV